MSKYEELTNEFSVSPPKIVRANIRVGFLATFLDQAVQDILSSVCDDCKKEHKNPTQDYTVVGHNVWKRKNSSSNCARKQSKHRGPDSTFRQLREVALDKGLRMLGLD